MRTTTVAAALALLCAPALAMDIPRIDADTTCKERVASKPRLAKGTPEEQYTACFAQMQTNYDRLKEMWGKVSDAAQRDCWSRSDLFPAFAYYQAGECINGILSDRRASERIANEKAKVMEIPAKEFRY